MDVKKPDIKRRAARGVAVLAVALAAGHLVQTMAKPDQIAVQETDLARAETTPTSIVPLAAGAMDAPVVSAPESPLPQAALPMPAESAAPDAVAITEPASETAQEPIEPMPVADACPVTLDAFAGSSAMISLTLTAPCRANERVVLRHAGLAVTELTTASGALFTAVPALDKAGQVEVLFADGTTVSASSPVPELAAFRRFGVQWQADDAFQVHAYENGADFGQPGDVSAANPQRPVPGMASSSGFLTLLGNPDANEPLLAEIYTYPTDAAKTADVTIEAAVTQKTCGRELLGDTLSSTAGEAVVTDLTVAMPDCTAVGDYLVLKNLAPDLKITAAN